MSRNWAIWIDKSDLGHIRQQRGANQDTGQRTLVSDCSCNTCRPLQGVEAFTDGSNTKRATLELQLRDKAGPNTIAGELPNASIEPCAGKSLFCLDSITYGQVIWPNAKFINV